MWKNFAQSLLVLSIAMLAALYSSSAGGEGRTITALVSAGIALGLAAWVAFRFVPRLARNVDWKRLPFVSRYKVAHAGWIYLAAVLIVIFAAVNTSNNLLYMVLSALLAVLLLSGFLSALNFRSVKLHFRLPARCFAGEEFQLSVRVENQKRLFPALSLDVRPGPRSVVNFQSLYFPAIYAQATVSQPGVASFPRRGHFNVERVTIGSRYPFGFFSKEQDHSVRTECICYPTIMAREQLGASVLDIQGDNQRFERGSGHDLYMIRDYVPSDSGRYVHWKASAKTGALKTREYAMEETRRMLLGLDRFGRPEDSDRFERLVSHAASLAFYWIQDGAEVALISDDWATPKGGKADALLDAILNYLATVQMSASAQMPDVERTPGALLLSLRQRRGHMGEHN